MRILIAVLVMFQWLIACTGDCLTCHPALVPTINQDERHKPMLTCIECHSSDPNAMAECGSDCFSCHPMEKINRSGIAQHAVIAECRDCHLHLKEQMSTLPPPMGQSYQPPLKELLLR